MPDTYAIGKPFPIDSLHATRKPKAENPRDVALIKAIRAAAAAAESQVIPFTFPETERVGTIRAAALRLVRTLEMPVNVGISRNHPNTILMSRGVLSNRGKRRA